MDKLKRHKNATIYHGFTPKCEDVCLSSDVEKLEAELTALRERVKELEDNIVRLHQERRDYSTVLSKGDSLNSSEWIWRTGKAERERDALKAELAQVKADLRTVANGISIGQLSIEFSDRYSGYLYVTKGAYDIIIRTLTQEEGK